MLAAPGATAPPRNLPRITSETKAPFRSAPRRHESCFLIAPILLRPKDLVKTTRKIGAIRIVAIAALAALGLRVPFRPLGSA